MKVKLKEGDLYVEVDTELSDDDVDILMPRPDYEQFLIYLQNNPIENIDFINFIENH